MWMNRGQRRRKAPRESKGSEQSHQFYGSQLNGAKCDHIAWWPVSAIRSGLQHGYLPRGYPWASLRVCLHLLCSRLIWPCVGIKSLFLPNHNQATFFPHRFFFFFCYYFPDHLAASACCSLLLETDAFQPGTSVSVKGLRWTLFIFCE